MESKLKHLEFIQAVINRLATNSFLFKGWAVTLAAALTAVATNESRRGLVVIAACSTALFWLIDGIYLSLERRYRELYDEVAGKDENQIDFSMKIGTDKQARRWLAAFVSRTLLLFYGAVLFLSTMSIFLARSK